MPIKGLTTGQQAAFPEIGQLRKGAPKPDDRHIGKDLTYFRFTSDIPEVEAAFNEAYDGEPRLINIFLPFATTDENMEAWQEEYVASGLKHRCDGEHVVLMQDKNGNYVMPTPNDPIRCPGSCKPVGRLKVIVPELRRLAFVTVLTTSIHDIRNLTAQLRALESLRGDLRGIPLQLRRRPKKISTPAGNGKRARREKWLLSVEAAPQWVELQLAAQQAQATPQIAAPEYTSSVVVHPPSPIDVEIVDDGDEDNGPTWDQLFDTVEEADDFEPPPDFLIVKVPAGDYKGRNLAWLLENDIDYVARIAAESKDRELKESAIAALKWHEAEQEELPL